MQYLEDKVGVISVSLTEVSMSCRIDMAYIETLFKKKKKKRGEQKRKRRTL